MKPQTSLVLWFFFFSILSILLIITRPSFSGLTLFFAKPSYSFFSSFPFFSNDVQKLREENASLAKKIVDQQKLILENSALRDQFETAYPKSFNLLPSNVISSPRFIPGFTLPESLVIDVGEKDGAKKGNAVVIKDNLLGVVSNVTNSTSLVTLASSPNFKFTARTTSNVLGIVKGQGNGDIVFDNVLLSDTISKEDLIVTSGDLKLDGFGLPSGLVIGKIVSVEKNPSELFQKAKVESFLDFSKAQTVFVVLGMQ